MRLATPTDELELSTRAIRGLAVEGLCTVGDIWMFVNLPHPVWGAQVVTRGVAIDRLYRIPGVGLATAEEIADAIGLGTKEKP